MHGRPFPYEGHHPVADVCRAVFKTGFRGWTILETFEDEGFNPDPKIISQRAEKAIASWIRLSEESGLAPCELYRAIGTACKMHRSD